MFLPVELFHSFLWLNNVTLYIYHIFIHPSVDGQLGCFYVLAIVNSAAMNIEVHASFQSIVSSRYMARVRLLDHMVGLFLVFEESPHCSP